MGIDAKLDKIVVQFAEVSNFSEVPLQSGRNSPKKKKTGWNHIGLKVKKVRKRSVAFGWHLVFSIRTCSGTVSRCTTDYCQTSTWDKSKKLASEQTITTIREKNGCCRIEMRPCEHDRPSCPTPQRYRPRQTRHGGCSHSQSCV